MILIARPRKYIVFLSFDYDILPVLPVFIAIYLLYANRLSMLLIRMLLLSARNERYYLRNCSRTELSPSYWLRSVDKSKILVPSTRI